MKKASTIRSISVMLGIIAVLLFIFSGCKSAQQKNEGEADTTLDEKSKEAVIEELSGYPIPTSYEITHNNR